MKNTNWNIVEPGQIVTFRYKSRSGRSVNRTVLCLDPEYLYRKESTNRIVRFFIGLELDTSDKPALPIGRVRQLFKILGEPDSTPTQTTAQEMERIYLSIKDFLKQNPIFKTYLLRKCRKNRVFLEDKYQSLNSLQVKKVAEIISEDEETTNILEDNLED
mgnify:FL=1